MAQELKLKRQTETPTGTSGFGVGTTDILDLLTGALRVSIDGWSLRYAPGEGEAIWDTFNLVGRETTDPALGSAVYDIQKFISDARKSANDNSRNEQFWLQYKPDNGTEIRTLVTDGDFSIESDPGKGGLGPLMNNDGYIRATLATQHEPAWEQLTQVTPTIGTMNVCGSIVWGTAITTGDLDGRISNLNFSGMASSTYLDDIWIGIRPTYYGTASFKSWWQLEDGIILAASGATIVADAAASSGTAVQVAFGTASMYQRMRISVEHVVGAGTAEHFAGKYLVLGRVKCGTSTECLIDTYQGLRQVNYSGTPQGIEMVGETKISNNLYKLIELGQVQIPPFGMRVAGTLGNELVTYSTFYIYAQRLSGAGNLWLDALCLVPCEHMLTVKNAGMGTSVDYLSYYNSPNGDSVCTIRATASIAEIVEHSVVNFNWPSDGGLVVVAAQHAAATAVHDLTVTADLAFIVYPRYSLMKL